MYTQKEIRPLREDVNKKFISIKILKKSHLTLPSHNYKNEESPRFSGPLGMGNIDTQRQAHYSPIRSRVDDELRELWGPHCPIPSTNLVFNAYQARTSRAGDSNGKKGKVPAL